MSVATIEDTKQILDRLVAFPTISSYSNCHGELFGRFLLPVGRAIRLPNMNRRSC